MTPTEFQAAIAELQPIAAYRDLVRVARRFRKALANPGQTDFLKSMDEVNVTLVGNATLDFCVDPLVAFLVQRGLIGRVTVGEFDSYVADLLDPNSLILKASPDFIAICLDYHAIRASVVSLSETEKSHQMAREQVELWRKLWQTAHDACGCTILHTNIATPIERPLGSRDSTNAIGRINYCREVNRLLTEETPSFVTICDAEHLSGVLGKRTWFNEAQWYTARQATGFEGTSMLSHALAASIAAHRGKSRKCLVLDLDNTLWGGVVGDVGIDKLKIRRGDPVGEAYLDFQSYCLSLQQRGILLAVCSKNQEIVAKEVFETHPEMVLGLEHISDFVANWDNKAKNLREIANRLNIGLDALVFVDDNPAERDLVRQLLPAVAVPELPEDPAHYRRVLDGHNYFEVVELSNEDFARGSMYEAEKQRNAAASQIDDLDAFLASLEQKCAIEYVDALSLQRTIQLLNKTNQFNTTTRRYAEAEILLRMKDPHWLCLCVRHEDRFADNGIIAVVMARLHGNAMTITDWVMSCRVFNRGIEQLTFSELVTEVKRRGVTSINGLFENTDRNSVVANLYRDFGFLHDAAATQKEQRWHLADLGQTILMSYAIELQRGLQESNSRTEDFNESRVA
jgi:FkbH-like protein